MRFVTLLAPWEREMLNLNLDFKLTSLEDVSRIIGDWKIKLSPRFMRYRPHYKVNIETNKYTLKTADNMDELIKLFHLRHLVFKGDETQIDVDHIDSHCDHLLIIDNEGKNVVGTYRLIFGPNFYSDSEFKLDNFKKLPGKKLELGRACITENHRNGAVIDLLWKGIGKYQELTGAQYLFGCSSIFTVNPKEMAGLMQQMSEKGRYHDNLKIRPIDKYTHPKLGKAFGEPMAASLPPLLASYFMAGAKVHGTPAFDADFDCFDWFTVLDLNDVSSSYKRRYFPHLI